MDTQIATEGFYRAPFSTASPTRFEFEKGMTLAEMVALARLPGSVLQIVAMQ